MEGSTIYLIIFVVISIGIVNGFKCPVVSSKTSPRQYDQHCWDGSSAALGCCRTGSSCLSATFGIQCDCETHCKGWSVDLGENGKHPEQDRTNHSVYGKDNQCKSVDGNSPSAFANLESCVILWEKSGCSGNHLTLNGGTMTDVRTKRLSAIHGVSGCSFSAPTFKQVKLYQHNFWSFFGAAETVDINAGECKFVGNWWSDRVSMIRPINEDCFKIWDHSDCTGVSKCICGGNDFALNGEQMPDFTSWDNQVKSLSLCNYPA